MSRQTGIYYAFLANADQVDFIDCLKRTSAAGLDILEVSAPKLHAMTKPARDEIVAVARDLGIRLTFAVALTREQDTGDEDRSIREAGIRSLISDARLAASMDGNLMGGILTSCGKYFPAGVENIRYTMMDRAAESLREVAIAAANEGVTLGIEAVNRFESPVVNTAEDALRVVRAAGSPNLGILLDTFHMNIEEAQLGDAIRSAGKYLVHLHACENNRALPGQGHIDWNDVFTALRDIHYRGALVMEALPGPYGTISGRLNIWRPLSVNVDAELKQANIFLHEKEEHYGI